MRLFGSLPAYSFAGFILHTCTVSNVIRCIYTFWVLHYKRSVAAVKKLKKCYGCDNNAPQVDSSMRTNGWQEKDGKTRCRYLIQFTCINYALSSSKSHVMSYVCNDIQSSACLRRPIFGYNLQNLKVYLEMNCVAEDIFLFLKTNSTNWIPPNTNLNLPLSLHWIELCLFQCCVCYAHTWQNTFALSSYWCLSLYESSWNAIKFRCCCFAFLFSLDNFCG